MADHDYLNGGWRDKYCLSKADGTPIDPSAIYFVLRLDEDPNAQLAGLAYSIAVQNDNPRLARDIRLRLRGCGVDIAILHEELRASSQLLPSITPEQRRLLAEEDREIG